MIKCKNNPFIRGENLVNLLLMKFFLCKNILGVYYSMFGLRILSELKK